MGAAATKAVNADEERPGAPGPASLPSPQARGNATPPTAPPPPLPGAAAGAAAAPDAAAEAARRDTGEGMWVLEDPAAHTRRLEEFYDVPDKEVGRG